MQNRETEIKLRVERPRLLKARLRSEATLLRRRHFEDNFVLDYPGGRLRRLRWLLRLRRTPGKTTLTLKGPDRIVTRMKVRSEVETQVEDADSMLRILKMMGLKVAFRYQKYRTVYRKSGCLIMLDETPIGTYVELEGPGTMIHAVAHSFGFQKVDFITDTYADLFQKYGRDNSRKKRNMMFGMEASVRRSWA